MLFRAIRSYPDNKKQADNCLAQKAVIRYPVSYPKNGQHADSSATTGFVVFYGGLSGRGQENDRIAFFDALQATYSVAIRYPVYPPSKEGGQLSRFRRELLLF